MVTNINTIVTNTDEDHHQSVRALAAELKISQESSICATPPFVYHSQELMFGRGQHNLYYKTCYISASIRDTALMTPLFNRQ